MPLPASGAASRSVRRARSGHGALLPLALALATVLAQLLLPLAHLEERRLGAQRAGGSFCVGAERGLQHLHAGRPAEGVPHDAGHCAVCTATAQARSTLTDSAPPALLAPAPAVLRPAVRAPSRPLAEAPRRSAPPRAPPVFLAAV